MSSTVPAEAPPVRVLFMGGKAVGCGVLRLLIEAPGVSVCGVVVNPDDMRAGRWYPSVAEIALANDIPARLSRNINSDEEGAWIRALGADLIVVAYYDQILPSEIFRTPSLGCVNLHLARAERYRGCYPTTWALINGDSVTGVTLHRVSEEIDGGDILAECEVPISRDDTGLSLYAKCTEAGIALLGDALPVLLAGGMAGRPQRCTGATQYHNRAFPSHEVCFEGDGAAAFNRIRALHFPPFPPPYINIGRRRFIIVEDPETSESDPSNQFVGTR